MDDDRYQEITDRYVSAHAKSPDFELRAVPDPRLPGWAALVPLRYAEDKDRLLASEGEFVRINDGAELRLGWFLMGHLDEFCAVISEIGDQATPVEIIEETRRRLDLDRYQPIADRWVHAHQHELAPSVGYRAVPSARLPGWVRLLPLPYVEGEEWFLFGADYVRLSDGAELTLGPALGFYAGNEFDEVICEIGDRATPAEIIAETERRLDARRR